MSDEELDRLRVPLKNDGYQENPYETSTVRRLLATIDALKAENERLKGSGVHTCHSKCQRTACVLRREVDALKAELSEARRERDEAQSSRQFTTDWYAVRWRRLRELLRGTDIETQACSIIANGTADTHEPPTYGRIVNGLRHELTAARAHAEKLAEALEYYADERMWIREEVKASGYEWASRYDDEKGECVPVELKPGQSLGFRYRASGRAQADKGDRARTALESYRKERK